MGVSEDPHVLLVRMLCNPVPCLHSKSSSCLLAFCWSFHAVAQGCNTPLLIFILVCSGSAAVKQLLPFPRQRDSVKKIILCSICVSTGKKKIKLKIFEILLVGKTVKLEVLSPSSFCIAQYLILSSSLWFLVHLFW